MVKLKLDIDPELPGKSGDGDDDDGDDAERDDNDDNNNNNIVQNIDINNPTLVDVMVVDEDMNIALNDDDTEQGDIDFVGENSSTQVVIEDLESGKNVDNTDAIDCRLHWYPFRRLLQQIRFRAFKDPSSTDPPKDRNDDDGDDTTSVRTDSTEATAIMIVRPSTSTEAENTIPPESLVDDEDMEMNSNSNLSNQVAANRSNGFDDDDDDFMIVIPGPNSSLRVSSPAHSYLFGRYSNSRIGSCRTSSCCAIIMCIIACCAAGLIVVYFAFLPHENDV